MAEIFHPGERVPQSGQYVIVGPRGGDRGGVERTVVKGEPFPPTPNHGEGYILVDPSNNGAGRGR